MDWSKNRCWGSRWWRQAVANDRLCDVVAVPDTGHYQLLPDDGFFCDLSPQTNQINQVCPPIPSPFGIHTALVFCALQIPFDIHPLRLFLLSCVNATNPSC